MTTTLTGILLLTLSTMATAKSYPPLQAETLQGQAISSKGKMTYLKFWATWCAYCVEEMPHLQQTYEQSQGRYQVIAVNVGFNQSIQGINTYINRYDYSFPVVFDTTGDMTRQYQVTGTPQHILLDANGTVIYRSALLTDELKQHLATHSGVQP
ncbi:TlpA family protein disulfide reductase [Pseudoalteromonas rubra]|uniref:Thioredoxin n=1 Tax=Pseudoalteromonas rubra TaxID=43658 RepID=A0A0U2X6K5_9GAMM|nr:TlpA disulfide reductase family protein [Pseudoalteromonas rubra]ALU43636.1 thioredoxin [Pseudoalteromonas rubra]